MGNSRSSIYKKPGSVKYKDDEKIHAQQATTTLTSTNLAEIVQISLKLKQKIIQSTIQQTFPMLVSLITERIKTSNKAPLDLVCVIDRSGSMAGEKIKLVKESFKYLLNFLGDQDRLSIVIFDHRASRLIPLKRMTPKNKKLVLSKLKGVKRRGMTNIRLGMIHAFEILTQRREMNPVTSIFLLSDGLDSGAENSVKDLLAIYNIPEDLTINTFGFGKDHDPQLMSDIADLRDGNFYFIEKLDTVDEAFVDCLGGLLSSVGQNILIKITPEKSSIFNEDIEITKAYGEASMWMKEGNSYITRIPNLISGKQRDFLLDLKIPVTKTQLKEHEKDVKVASAQVTMAAFDGKIMTKTVDFFITLLNDPEKSPPKEDSDRDVMKNFYRLKGASVLTEARNLADRHQYDDARKLLQNFQEELEGSFLKSEEFIINLSRDIVKALEDVNPEVYEQFGKHNMMENARAQMHQKVNLKSANCYQNEMQIDMITQVKSMKGKK